MKGIRVERHHVENIVHNLGLTMVNVKAMGHSNASNCVLTNGACCNDECGKLGLSADQYKCGTSRDGGCVLYRLYNVFYDNTNGCDQIYALPELTIQETVGDI